LETIGLVVKADGHASRKANELESWLNARGVRVLRRQSRPPGGHSAPQTPESAPPDLLCVFALGGDGTFLGAARWVGDQSIPLLGVKFGEVGFLAETAEDDLLSAAEKVLNRQFDTIPRMRLVVEVLREGTSLHRATVLNDVVVNKGALARLSHIQTYIDDHYLTTYRADGLIVSTPTGSTAYSLAAGGPIIHPSVPGIIMTPICPFTLTNRPLIVPDSVCIKMQLTEKSANNILTFDGQAGLEIDERDTVFIRKGAHPLYMVTIPGQHYFDVLKEKLRWSGGRA
jgi:NAD+ kinase